MGIIIALQHFLGNCRAASACAALPCMVPARPMSTPPPGGPNPQPQQAPSPLTLHGQYIKDLSFENPRAPQSLIEQKQPQLTLNVNVSTKQFEAKTFEVSLTIEANAATPEKEPLFVLELIYAGTVTLGDVPQDAFGPLLLIETPRLLFPFARAIVANATREAGFPPLNIAPVDFVALYRQQLEAQGGNIPGVPPGQVGHA
jgi:preprotein translocase subunit SecB